MATSTIKKDYSTSSLSTTHTVRYSINRIKRDGHVVSFTINLLLTSNVERLSSVIATLPTGFCPSGPVYLSAIDDTHSESPTLLGMILNSDGKIYSNIAIATSSTIAISGCFVS